MQKVDNKEVKLLVNTKSARKVSSSSSTNSNLSYKIILSYHSEPASRPGSPKRQPALPAPCDHKLITFDVQPEMKRIICKKCHRELRRWISRSGINFDELMVQHEFVFGPPTVLDFKIAHEMK